jgi:hypothetical protein
MRDHGSQNALVDRMKNISVKRVPSYGTAINTGLFIDQYSSKDWRAQYFDPQGWKDKTKPQPGSNRRGSMSSVFSFEIDDAIEGVPTSIRDQTPTRL